MNPSTNNAIRVEYFDFEKDFMDDGIRCIPMIVRFKLDACGIKLKLKEWNKMELGEREDFANLFIDTVENLDAYRSYVEQTIARLTSENPTYLSPNQKNSTWMMTDQIPDQVREKLRELRVELGVNQWATLSDLKRYTLLKLSRPGHENRNFPKALKEFGLL